MFLKVRGSLGHPSNIESKLAAVKCSQVNTLIEIYLFIFYFKFSRMSKSPPLISVGSGLSIEQGMAIVRSIA